MQECKCKLLTESVNESMRESMRESVSQWVNWVNESMSNWGFVHLLPGNFISRKMSSHVGTHKAFSCFIITPFVCSDVPDGSTCKSLLSGGVKSQQARGTVFRSDGVNEKVIVIRNVSINSLMSVPTIIIMIILRIYLNHTHYRLQITSLGVYIASLQVDKRLDPLSHGEIMNHKHLVHQWSLRHRRSTFSPVYSVEFGQVSDHLNQLNYSSAQVSLPSR